MTYRNLRIAWSVAWGIVAVLLICLWVRSYWKFDMVTLPYTCPTMLTSSRGAIGASLQAAVRNPTWSWTVVSVAKMNADLLARGRTPPTRPKMSPFRFDVMRTYLVMSYVYPVLFFCAFASVPWMSHLRRFSVRTLLIATTFIAVGLGLIVWATR